MPVYTACCATAVDPPWTPEEMTVSALHVDRPPTAKAPLPTAPAPNAPCAAHDDVVRAHDEARSHRNVIRALPSAAAHATCAKATLRFWCARGRAATIPRHRVRHAAHVPGCSNASERDRGPRTLAITRAMRVLRATTIARPRHPAQGPRERGAHEGPGVRRALQTGPRRPHRTRYPLVAHCFRVLLLVQ